MKFNKTLETVNAMIMPLYPTARFYEAQGILDETNGEIQSTVSEMTIVYSLVPNKSIIVKVKGESNIDIDVINSPWLEDRVMTPYVSMSLEEAIDQIKRADFSIKSHNIVLRHPLNPDCIVPEYILGDNKSGYVSVNIFTGDVQLVK